MRATRRGRRLLATSAVLLGLAVAGAVALRSLPGQVVVAERCTAVADGTTHVLAPDQAGNAATIAAIAVQRGLPARAATIGIATAIQESKLRNIDYGDRDSLGLFQQRPSQGWGTPEQVMDPIYSTNAFYDVLIEVSGYADLEITDAAQRVQRSGFPEAYADHEPEGRAFASALTGYSPGALTCRLRPPEGTGDPVTLATALSTQHGQLPVTTSGTGLLVDAGAGPEGERRAWAVAAWAVARAGDSEVVRVVTGGREWRRDAADDGWAEARHPEEAGPGQVLVEVALAEG